MPPPMVPVLYKISTVVDHVLEHDIGEVPVLYKISTVVDLRVRAHFIRWFPFFTKFLLL